jgi:hypothetical protein
MVALLSERIPRFIQDRMTLLAYQLSKSQLTKTLQLKSTYTYQFSNPAKNIGLDRTLHWLNQLINQQSDD